MVSLQPSATSILASLGELGRLVACTKYCADICPGVASGRLILADSWTAQAHEIASVNPDLVIAAVPYQEKAVAEIMKAGARFLGLAPRSLADIYADIAVIAGAIGVPERGSELIASMQREIEHVRAKTVALAPDNRPWVFCEEWGNPVIASQPWVAELVEAAGGKFVGEAGKRTTREDVRQRDPQVVIAAWCGAGDRVPLQKIIDGRQWGELSAVRNGRVYCIRDEFLNTPGPSLIQGLHALAAAIHPEHFPRPHGLRCITDVHAPYSQTMAR